MLERIRPRSRGVSAVLALAAAAVLFGGCAVTHMREVHPAQPIGATAGAASVLFVRPHAYPAGMHYVVLDTQAGPSGREVQFLGESWPSSHFVAHVPAGEHVFLASGNGRTEALHGHLAEGRLYVVEVDTGAFQGMRLVAVTQKSARWKDVRAWLDETTQLAPDRLAGQADLMRHGDAVDEVVEDGLDRWKRYEGDDAIERTLSADDGVP